MNGSLLTEIDAKAYVEKIRATGQKTIFVSGCFDLFHLGHLSFLQFAQKAADRIIVGVEDDNRVEVLKGKGRPIQPIADRIKSIQMQGVADFVFVLRSSSNIEFQDYFLKLIHYLRPDYLLIPEGKNFQFQQEKQIQIETAGGTPVFYKSKHSIHSSQIIEKFNLKRPLNEEIRARIQKDGLFTLDETA